MSAHLDFLCPYSCLSPMVVHLKTCILMFLRQLCAPFFTRLLKCKMLASHRLSHRKCLQLCLSRFIYARLARSDDPGISYTCSVPLRHSLLVSILLWTKLVKDVKQTSYSGCDAFTALKIAVVIAKKWGFPCWMLNESTWFKGKCTLFYSCFGNCWRLA